MWNIHLVKNSVIIPEKKIEAISKLIRPIARDHFPYDDDHVIWSDGRLAFDEDSFEHMDWLCRNEKAMEIIALSGVNGMVQFADMEGDNKGSFWGVTFHDKKYQLLDGHIVYFTVGEEKCTKRKR